MERPYYKYKTLNLIEISKKALISNYNYFQNLQPSSKICPVLKSNAYGHGLTLVGKLVSEEIKPEFMCVDSLYEAYELKKSGVKNNILIMGYTFPENFKVKKLAFNLPLFDVETLRILNTYQPGIKIHLKIDTGMNRLGIKESQYEVFAKELKRNSHVIIEGIYSHLCDAENKDDAFTKEQIAKFLDAVKYFKQQGFDFKYRHLFSTSSALKYQHPDLNMARIGLGFYGIDAASQSKSTSLQPALKFISHVIEIKKIKKGEIVSYNRTFKAKNNMVIGIIPAGYYDGVDRRLSNNGWVEINQEFCPIIGNICMNIFMVDVSAVKKPKVGLPVVIYSNINANLNSLVNCSRLAETIPHVLLANLSETTRRILV